MDTDESYLKIVAIILTTAISSIVKFFDNPANKETKLNQLRMGLLSVLRLKLSIEIASIIPPLDSKIYDSNYIATIKEALLGYLSNNIMVVIDLVDSERVYLIVKKRIRLFKYMPVIILALSIVAFLILPFIMSTKVMLTYLFIWIAIFLIIIFLIWLMQERSYDKFHDICLKYEITENAK